MLPSGAPFVASVLTSKIMSMSMSSYFHQDGSTLMHVAAQAGHPDTAMVFLKRGVPLHMPNKDGAVCLHTAARKGHVGVVKALLSKGARVDTKTKVTVSPVSSITISHQSTF